MGPRLLILLILALPALAQTFGYTPAQADRGKAAYAASCATCHSPDLKGGNESPSLVGDAFLTKWKNRPVGNLLENIRTTMPADRPGTLHPQPSLTSWRMFWQPTITPPAIPNCDRSSRL